MNDRNKSSAAQKSAQGYFAKAVKGETAAKKVQKQERAAASAKTNKLRDQRLAKEAADRLANPAPAVPPVEIDASAERPRYVKPKTTRMIY